MWESTLPPVGAADRVKEAQERGLPGRVERRLGAPEPRELLEARPELRERRGGQRLQATQMGKNRRSCVSGPS